MYINHISLIFNTFSIYTYTCIFRIQIAFNDNDFFFLGFYNNLMNKNCNSDSFMGDSILQFFSSFKSY